MQLYYYCVSSFIYDIADLVDWLNHKGKCWWIKFQDLSKKGFHRIKKGPQYASYVLTLMCGSLIEWINWFTVSLVTLEGKTDSIFTGNG